MNRHSTGVPRLGGRGLILALFLTVMISNQVVAGPVDWARVRTMPDLPLFRTGDEGEVSFGTCGKDNWKLYSELDSATLGVSNVFRFLGDEANILLCAQIDPLTARGLEDTGGAFRLPRMVNYGEQFALRTMLGSSLANWYLSAANCVQARSAFWLSALMSSTDLSHPAHMAFWKDKAAFFFPSTWKHDQVQHRLLVPRMKSDEDARNAFACLKQYTAGLTARWEGVIIKLQEEGKERRAWLIDQAAMEYKIKPSAFYKDPSKIELKSLFDLSPAWRGTQREVADWINQQLLYKKLVGPDPNAPAFRAGPNDHHSSHGSHGSHAHDPHTVPGRRPGPYTREPGAEWEEFDSQLRYNNRNRPAFPPRIPVRR